MHESDGAPAPRASPHEPLPEGDEAPPPGVRTMALVRWALVGLMAVAAVGSWALWAELAPRHAAASVQYRCPMHPAVLQERPGACPICGMDLVAARDGAAAHAPPAQPAAAAPTASGKYWCPMHPEVASDDPEARCDRCGGMKLVPRTQLMGVRTAAVVRERLRPRLRTVGFVSADERRVALVTARFTGWIEELRVAQTGERVEKGQILATVYSPELVTAQQVYLNAARWSETGSGTAGAGAASLQDDARRRIEVLGVDKADLAELTRRGAPLVNMPLRAPVAGWVAKKTALPGLYLQPGTELFQIADLSTVWVIADVYERDLARVKVGQHARFEAGALPGERFEGRVDFVYPAVSPESRTLQARIGFKNPGLRLRPGMFGDVAIEVGGAEGLTAPEEALVDTGELQYVFVARGRGRFEPRVVRVGGRADGRVQLLEGVAEGELVVTTAGFLVDSESRLRAAVEAFRPVAPAEEASEREGDDRREHARAEGR